MARNSRICCRRRGATRTIRWSRQLARETLHEIVIRLPLLTPRERDCLALVAAGASRSDVVARIGGDEKAVDNAVQRARRKLQPAA